ncbi:glyoxalase [Sporolactobacillus sp. THM7-7]|nr:glyoxalase [Sporolactobacillus sp. THM7-7]
MTLTYAENKQSVYHFAFTIPGTLFRKAKEWFKSKVPLNKDGNDDEVYFAFMDAHSFYFYDPDGNVVECIARNRCPGTSDTFSIKDVVDISEINLTVKNVLEEGKKLMKQGFQPIDHKPLTAHGLNFIGDFHSYFLLGPENRTWFFSDKRAVIGPVTVELARGMTVGVNGRGNIFFRQEEAREE